jgi:hypothetical protein
MMKTMKLRHRISVLSVLILSFSLFLFGCGEDGESANDKAQDVLEQILNCTLQEADDFMGSYADLTSNAATDGSVGISVDDSSLKTYFQEKFESTMTDECILQVMNNRICTESFSLAQQYQSDITVKNIQLQETSAEQNVYSYTAELFTDTEESAVASVYGTITMTQEDDTWKAQNLSMTVK